MNRSNKISIELNPFLQSTSQTPPGTSNSKQWIYLNFIKKRIVLKFIKKIKIKKQFIK